MRKHVVAWIGLLLLILLSGCNFLTIGPINSTQSQERTDASFFQEPPLNLNYGDYVIRYYRTSEIDERQSVGVFRKIAEDNFKLIIQLQFLNYDWKYFAREGYFYEVGIDLIRYDLDAENPESTKTITNLLPKNFDNIKLYNHDADWIYISARPWQGKDHDQERSYYAVRYDGSEYKLIQREDVP